MKKLIVLLLGLQLLLAGCCCPCGKKMQNSQEPTQPQAQPAEESK